MTTFELAGQAMMHAQDGNRNLLRDVLGLLRGGRAETADEPLLSGSSLIDLEPDLAAEAHVLPEHMRTI